MLGVVISKIVNLPAKHAVTYLKSSEFHSPASICGYFLALFKHCWLVTQLGVVNAHLGKGLQQMDEIDITIKHRPLRNKWYTPRPLAIQKKRNWHFSFRFFQMLSFSDNYRIHILQMNYFLYLVLCSNQGEKYTFSRHLRVFGFDISTGKEVEKV